MRHGQAISTVYPHVKYIREYYATASRDKYKGAGPPLKSNSLQGAWNKGAPLIHPGGDHPADVQCCINHTLGTCKKDSGCRYLHQKVKCRFEQQMANVTAVTAPLGIRRKHNRGSAGISSLAHVTGSHADSRISF
jgi:hypothetical protein